MANTPDLASCLASDAEGSNLLPLSPFHALRYHFGMLMGVDDFQTEQGYHRAKMRLHNAWLHREGVVWGFDVKMDKTRSEVRVTPGLALDAAGHELHLEGEACVNLVEWLEKHEQDPDFEIKTGGDAKEFNAHVVIRFKSCMTRQVPALVEPCDGTGTGTTYSRVFETIEILLLPNLSRPRVYPYHLLRLLFGLEGPKKDEADAVTPEDQAVLDELANIKTLAVAEQPAAFLKAFHRFAALDEISLKPATSEDGARTLLFPGRDDDPIVLADITGIKLIKQDNQWVLDGGLVDVSVRPSHVATTTIQDLLCGRCVCMGGESAGGSSEGSESGGGESESGGGGENAAELGPRVDVSLLQITDTYVVLKFDQPLEPATIKAEAFSLSVFDSNNGWNVLAVKPSIDDQHMIVTLNVEAPAESRPRRTAERNKVALRLGRRLTRVIARGTGSVPILGQNFLPMAGATTDAPAPQGADFVFMKLSIEKAIKERS